MIDIRFSHLYKKMPSTFENTIIVDVSVVDYMDLTLEEIEKDTETVDGEFYPLPPGKLIWIKLRTGEKEWGTMRRYKVEKFKYYIRNIGKKVNILIDKNANGRIKSKWD